MCVTCPQGGCLAPLLDNLVPKKKNGPSVDAAALGLTSFFKSQDHIRFLFTQVTLECPFTGVLSSRMHACLGNPEKEEAKVQARGHYQSLPTPIHRGSFEATAPYNRFMLLLWIDPSEGSGPLQRLSEGTRKLTRGC